MLGAFLLALPVSAEADTSLRSPWVRAGGDVAVEKIASKASIEREFDKAYKRIDGKVGYDEFDLEIEGLVNKANQIDQKVEDNEVRIKSLEAWKHIEHLDYNWDGIPSFDLDAWLAEQEITQNEQVALGLVTQSPVLNTNQSFGFSLGVGSHEGVSALGISSVYYASDNISLNLSAGYGLEAQTQSYKAQFTYGW